MIANASKALADRPWLDPAARPQIVIDGVEMSTVPPHERPVNMMFQS